ncbi:dTDP-4-dehydrorhamnose reductase [Desulfonauticus submarinus]|uniref:dTDP-4-dehydrorhamnose reductase n=1 Tax=Desulfonauticus submarinus TaxID=206665 RepID=A0A1H0CLG3_9BACT|nr:dTDP-4-dehydrorhamnose reductase [Desulfonauticus submarinus]SDN58621.1 dTDP-4-dehydrorhamnose reductase [Desulfonauticus submarinus]
MENKIALILGGQTGLLGQAITDILNKNKWEAISPAKNKFNIFSSEELKNFIQKHHISYVFNTIAYTQVDKAEQEQKKAIELNRTFPVILGNVCKELGIYLIHYSTDFVFNGQKESPYEPTDPPCPLNIYGKTKLEGEKNLLEITNLKLLIIRTAWLFGQGKVNFVSKILNLAKEKQTLNVVHDQVGSPTYTYDLAKYSLQLVNTNATGIFHIVNSGQASWCELAQEAVHCLGLQCKIIPISSHEFPQTAKRPTYSVLSTKKFTEQTGITPRPWVQALREYLYSFHF